MTEHFKKMKPKGYKLYTEFNTDAVRISENKKIKLETFIYTKFSKPKNKWRSRLFFNNKWKTFEYCNTEFSAANECFWYMKDQFKFFKSLTFNLC